MAALASDWLRHFWLLLWNSWTEFNETWQEARSQRPLRSLCFSGRSEKQDGCPGLWLAETFSTSPLKPLNGIQWNLTGRKISMSSTKFVFFGSIGKTRWLPYPLIGWDIFNFSSETAERNSMKLDRKEDLNVLYQVCIFRVNRKNKMAALASDWLRHFRLLFWNRWTEFKETWLETRSQRPLPSLCFSGRSEKQDGRPGLWLAETFSTSRLKPLNGIQRNLTGRKISTSSTKFVFFWPIEKTRWPPWPLIGWDIFDFFSETAERNSKKLDRKEDLKVFLQVCFFFRLMSRKKFLSWLICQKGGTLYSGARYVALLASCLYIVYTNEGMNFTLCVLLAYNDNGSVQTLCITCIYLHCLHVFGLWFISRSLWNSCIYLETRKVGTVIKWKILGKIILCNNLVIINTKRILIFYRVKYSLTMILVFKQIFNTIIVGKMINFITQGHQKFGLRQWLGCTATWRR